MAGPSGFMLFRTSDHGALLRSAGQTKRAVQYLFGNPLFTVRMTQHDIRAGLYAPLRVLVYEDEGGKTCVEYDRAPSLFGSARFRAVRSSCSSRAEMACRLPGNARMTTRSDGCSSSMTERAT